MVYRFIIDEKLPSLNDYIFVCRANRFGANQMKRNIENAINKYTDHIPFINNPVYISFLWIDANRRRDLDNIAFAKKFILDALQKKGILKNDNRECVIGFSDNFALGKDYKIIVELRERPRKAFGYF